MESISFARVARDLAFGIDENPTCPCNAAEWNLRFKVGELKVFLKQCREYGYATNISQNKKGLSDDLHAIFSGATPPRAPNGSTPTARLAHMNIPLDNAAPPLPGTSSISITASVPAAPAQRGGLVIPAPLPAPPDLGPHMDLYRNLMAWECFTSAQLLSAIQKRVTSGGAVTEDVIVSDLVGGGEQISLSDEEIRLREERAQRQFEEDMDKAILDSEEDREHIQECKKRRKAELKTDPSCLFGEAVEFSTSYLLNKRCVGSAHDVLSPIKIVHHAACFIDSMSGASCGTRAGAGSSSSCSTSRSSSSADSSLNAAALQDLRSAVYELLELEMLSYKWYKDRSTGYFIDVEKQIARSCVNDHNIDYKKYFRMYVRDVKPGERRAADEDKAHAFVSDLLTCLRRQVERVSADLYTYSSNSGIPQAFLDCDPDKKHEATYSMEDDGFEIL